MHSYVDRVNRLQSGPYSATNIEYLKHCVFKFMSSTDTSEKKRLVPVIATILNLTADEKKAVSSVFAAEDEQSREINVAISSIGSIATSSFGGIWDSLGFSSS